LELTAQEVTGRRNIFIAELRKATSMHERTVTVIESGNGPYGQFITSGHHVLGADEPEALGGRDTGPDPYELLLAALGACTAMTVRMYANRKGLSLERISVRLRHSQRASGNELKDRFERLITLEGRLTPAERARLMEVADRCPVSQTLQRSSEVSSFLAESEAVVAPEFSTPLPG
jgi:putative redox protein